MCTQGTIQVSLLRHYSPLIFCFVFLETVFHQPSTGQLAPAIYLSSVPQIEDYKHSTTLGSLSCVLRITLKCFCLQHKFSQLGPFLSPLGCLLLLLFLIEYCFHCIIDIFRNSDYQKDKIFGIKKFITWRVRHEHIHSKIFYSSFFISLRTLLSSKFSM